MEINYAELKAEKAANIFRQGYNCSQSVVLAFAEEIGIDEEKLKAITCGFGGGMGRMREVCGAFSGMAFMAGVIYPSTDPSDKAQRTANYALVQEFAAAFKEENGGSIICRELLGLPKEGANSPAPSTRTADFYKKRPCEQIVRTAARIVAEKIMTSNQ